MTLSASSVAAAAVIGAAAIVGLDYAGLINSGSSGTHNYVQDALLGAAVGLAVQIGAGMLGVS